MRLQTATLGKNVSQGCEMLFRHLRREKRSQYSLALALGVSDGHINQWIHGVKRPSLRYAVMLADECGIDVASWHRPASPSFVQRFRAAAA